MLRRSDGCRAVCLEAACTSAAAQTTVVALDDHVAEFAGKTVVAVYYLSVDNYAGAYAGAESYHDEVFEAARRAICHFSEGGRVGVVGDGYGYSEFLAHELGQRQAGPGKVHGVVDPAGVVVGIGCADADTLYFVGGVVGINQTAGLCAVLRDSR